MTRNDTLVMGALSSAPKTIKELVAETGLSAPSVRLSLSRLVPSGAAQRSQTSHPYTFWKEPSDGQA